MSGGSGGRRRRRQRCGQAAARPHGTAAGHQWQQGGAGSKTVGAAGSKAVGAATSYQRSRANEPGPAALLAARRPPPARSLAGPARLAPRGPGGGRRRGWPGVAGEDERIVSCDDPPPLALVDPHCTRVPHHPHAVERCARRLGPKRAPVGPARTTPATTRCPPRCPACLPACGARWAERRGAARSCQPASRGLPPAVCLPRPASRGLPPAACHGLQACRRRLAGVPGPAADRPLPCAAAAPPCMCTCLPRPTSAYGPCRCGRLSMWHRPSTPPRRRWHPPW